jgi:hypothetical protein
MNRLALLLAALVLAAPCAAGAQVVPTPPSHPQTYDDPAMHFEAPPGFVLVAKHPVDERSLGENPQIVAAWRMAQPPRVIMIQQEAFDGDVNGFEAAYEQQVRNQSSNALFSHQEHMSLENGMPAVFMEVTIGSGFNEQKGYIVCWADGTRGVALVLFTQIGDIDEETARQLLSNASAVAYPAGRGD